MQEPTPPFLTRRQVWTLTGLAILNHITFTGARVNVSLTAIHLGIAHVIATEPELVDGAFTGTTTGVLNMRAGKVTRLHAWLAERGYDKPLIVNAGAFFLIQQRQDEQRVWTQHTYEVLEALRDLEVQTLNMQSGLRGYQLTRDPVYLAPYNDGVDNYRRVLIRLRGLMIDNPAQQSQLDRLDAVVATWRSEVTEPTRLLIEAGIETSGAHAVVVGRSMIVGKPMALLLMAKGKGGDATVTVTHSRTRDLAAITRTADIIIAAIGRPHFIKAEHVKEGAVVIDVGINRVDDPTTEKGYKLVGDVAYDEVAPKCRAITPVPGGVGPMTIAMLMANTIKACKQA